MAPKQLGFLALVVGLAAAGCGDARPTTDGGADGASPLEAGVDVDHAAAESAVAPGPAGELVKQVTVSGLARSYLLYVPASALGQPAPVLVALHGAGQKAANFVAGVGLKQLADANGALLIAPQALTVGGATLWGASPHEGWTSPDGQSSSVHNDLALLLAVLGETQAAYAVDSQRIFLCGFSRGAGFAGLVATASGATFSFTSPFTGYAVSAGYDMFGGSLDLKKSQPKRPFWLAHGDKDKAVPFSLGKSFAEALDTAGWPSVKFTAVADAPHDWLWHGQYGLSNQQLWDWLLQHAK